MKPGEIKICRALNESDEGLTFTELRKKAAISGVSLSKYLTSLQEIGIVKYQREKKLYYAPNPYDMTKWELNEKKYLEAAKAFGDYLVEKKSIEDLMKYHKEIISWFTKMNWQYSYKKGYDFMMEGKNIKDKYTRLLFILMGNIEISKLCNYALEKVVINKTIEFNGMDRDEYLHEINKITNNMKNTLIEPYIDSFITFCFTYQKILINSKMIINELKKV